MEKHYLLNCVKIVFEREIWQRVKYFFLRPARKKILSPLEPI